MHILDVRDLSRHFGGLRAVDGVNFSAKTGSILSIIGPNGAGKPRSSTVSRALSGRAAAASFFRAARYPACRLTR